MISVVSLPTPSVDIKLATDLTKDTARRPKKDAAGLSTNTADARVKRKAKVPTRQETRPSQSANASGALSKKRATGHATNGGTTPPTAIYIPEIVDFSGFSKSPSIGILSLPTEIAVRIFKFMIDDYSSSDDALRNEKCLDNLMSLALTCKQFLGVAALVKFKDPKARYEEGFELLHKPKDLLLCNLCGVENFIGGRHSKKGLWSINDEWYLCKNYDWDETRAIKCPYKEDLIDIFESEDDLSEMHMNLEENKALTEENLKWSRQIFCEAKEVKKWLGLKIPGWNTRSDWTWEDFL